MEPALDVVHRALHGDPGARSFLERTTSIYVLDVTDASKPKTYGCWNFIHQAMNEVERYEARFGQNTYALQQEATLVGHVRLLATMALRVARRSPSRDRALVATCIANASQYSGTEGQSQWLIDLNLELREIVMGRIAAMAFDFSFHRKTGAHGHSAFADPVVMDTFCAILSANAVFSGANAIRHFATEWIIPSSRHLPTFALASVVLHLASEGMRKTAPAGTKDMLQQLSVSVMSAVLAPVLSDAIAENSDSPGTHAESSRVAAMCIKAMKTWCDATDLSLPQIKHICSKVNINIIGLVNDAMYSDSHQVVDAMAELIESTVRVTEERAISEERMNQVRHIIQVDEPSFRTQFSPEQLKTIESTEMKGIVDELMSSCGLQRFRFSERQSNRDHDVCRNLARVAASVCSTWLDISPADQTRQPEQGIITLLLKAAAHPSVHISGISLQVLARVTPSSVALAQELLPILQRRGITPHNAGDGSLSSAALDTSGVNYDEFKHFRESILSDALVACWSANSDAYMDSCTLAVEEFCSDQSSKEFSLHLEAAIYCIETVTASALDSDKHFSHAESIKRVTDALCKKPPSLTSNPLTLARACRLLRKYTRWFIDEGGLGVASDLALTAFNLSASSQYGEEAAQSIMKECSVSPMSEACSAIKEILCRASKEFTSSSSLSSLQGVWQASFAATDRDVISIDDRIALGAGLCSVLALLPDYQQRINAFEELVRPCLDCLERRSGAVDRSRSRQQTESILSRVADEMRLLASLSRGFTNASSPQRDAMESGCDTSPDRRGPIAEPILTAVRDVWPLISHFAANYSDHETISTNINSFLAEFLPPTCTDESSLTLLKNVTAIASTVISKAGGSLNNFTSVCYFLDQFVHTYGEAIEKDTSSGKSENGLGRILEDLLLDAVTVARDHLGSEWTRAKEQGQGQPAFESKPSPSPHPESVSNGCLVGTFSVLASCVDICPCFSIRLAAGPAMHRDDDLLLRRAIDSAMASLNENDSELVSNAMKLLKATVKQAESQDEALRSFTSESVSRIRAETVNRLLLGCCGKYENRLIGDAAGILSSILCVPLSSDVEADIVAALKQDYFLLGDESKNVTLGVLSQCSRNTLSLSDLTLFLDEVWDLHQVEDTEALPGSDAVARFIKKYHS